MPIRFDTTFYKYTLAAQKISVLAAFLLLCYSCNFENKNIPSTTHTLPEISVKAVKEYTRLIDEEIDEVIDWENCLEPNDTLFENYPFSFLEALEEIQIVFRAIDTTNYNLETRQYLKALTLADFVFAISSFRLLGDDDGIRNDTFIIDSWHDLPLSVCYDIANQNFAALYCGERTDFFRRLCDTLLQLPTEEINFMDGFHIFPLVNIQGVHFLIDPYSPFIVYDVHTLLMLPFDSVFVKNEYDIKIERSNRIFGCSRELVSTPLLKEISTTEIICDVKDFVKQTALQKLGRLPDSALLNHIHISNFKTAVRVGNNSRFQYALRICGRPDKDRFRTVEDMKLFYDTSLPGKSF